jgi:hypothetical protein
MKLGFCKDLSYLIVFFKRVDDSEERELANDRGAEHDEKEAEVGDDLEYGLEYLGSRLELHLLEFKVARSDPGNVPPVFLLQFRLTIIRYR